MLSLRALARAAPRTASRFAATSSIRPAFQNALRSRITAQTPRIATFTTTRTRFDEYSQQLVAKLDNEIDIETQESAQQAGSDSNVDQFKAENPSWEIKDTEGGQDVYLTRKFDDEDITVHFSIADFNSQMYNEDEMDTAMADEEDMEVQSGGANTKGSVNRGGTANQNFKVAPEDSIAPADREELRDEEDEQSPAYPVSVEVLIQRPNKGALKFDLVASDGDFMVEKLVQLPQSGKTTDAAAILRSDHDSTYPGPPFAQLDEEVQGILESYLNARGITNHLAMFIPDYIDVKEQKEYLGWLKRVKDFVE
ncbi:Mitochondrial acidic MAM33 [Lecanosticta acicola]|uniref:Mitochondrial acidic MAM33 n=1 Tax=Lecanosticta acicola TaxID=111012 RepID=A0AAI9EDH7_9PEZI|nr:Mitochondrial acidic MAM33 [Lecanosticta acicola]